MKDAVKIPRVFFDMDGTLAEWKDAEAYEELFQKGYYASLLPQFSIVNAARLLAESGVHVYILSAYLVESQYALTEKKTWCDRWLPFIPSERRVFCPTAAVKAEVVGPLCAGDVLIDDYSKNLREWTNAGGAAVKVLNGINGRNGTWTGARVSLNNSPARIAAEILNTIGKATLKIA